jgi:hydrogenase nickel incorporation protein HypB
MNRVAVEKKVLSENDKIAARLRDSLDGIGALSLNFIGSPGAGKTALLERTLELLPAHTRAAVVTGDIQTENDAIRLRRYGYPVRQITTAGALPSGRAHGGDARRRLAGTRPQFAVHRKRGQPGLPYQL